MGENSGGGDISFELKCHFRVSTSIAPVGSVPIHIEYVGWKESKNGLVIPGVIFCVYGTLQNLPIPQSGIPPRSIWCPLAQNKTTID